MPAHYKDKTRDTTDPKHAGEYYRLFGIDAEGQTYFYWSTSRAEYAGYYGPNSDPVWGTLTCKNRMKPCHLVFIADMAMVRKLEDVRFMHPCRNCRYEEYKIWKASKTGAELTIS